MRTSRSATLIISASLLPVAIGCSFTLPTPPQLSGSDTNLSKAGALMVQAVKTDPEQQQLAESVAAEVVRCEGRLTMLFKKMRDERNGKAATALIGGGISAGSGVTSAVLSGEDNAKDAAIATAIIAATGGVVAIAAQLIGDPAADLQLYDRHLAHYNKARSIAEKIRFASTDDFYKGPGCADEFELAGAEARKCEFLKQKAREKSEGEYEKWVATQSLDMISELRLCSDAQASTASGDVGRKESGSGTPGIAPSATQRVIPPAGPSATPTAPVPTGSSTAAPVAPTARPR